VARSPVHQTHSAPHLLLIADWQEDAAQIGHILKQEGYQVTQVARPREVAHVLSQTDFDLILLRSILQHSDSYQHCTSLRRQLGYKIPILMYCPQEENAKPIPGLESGADDYFCADIASEELLARLKVALRHCRSLPHLAQKWRNGQVLQVENVILDPVARRVWRAGNDITLTAREFDVLYALMQQVGRTVTRDQFLEHVWGFDNEVEFSVLKVCICSLRQKLNQSGQDDLIRSVRGIGYMLCSHSENSVL
jgi:DNA-binding response OmpR family regulator